MRSARFLIPCLAAAGLLAFLPSGCSNSSAGRSVLQIIEVNKNAPLQSDVVKMVSGSPIVIEDSVPVTIKNVPHDGIVSVTPDGPFGYIVLDRYDITFESPEDIPPVTGNLGWMVPTGESINGSIVIVPGALKLEAPLAGLAVGGEILSVAHVKIQGHEATSNYPVRAEFTIQVNFANWQDN